MTIERGRMTEDGELRGGPGEPLRRLSPAELHTVTWAELFAPAVEVATRALDVLAAWMRENKSALEALVLIGEARQERLSAMHREYRRRQKSRRRRR